MAGLLLIPTEMVNWLALTVVDQAPTPAPTSMAELRTSYEFWNEPKQIIPRQIITEKLTVHFGPKYLNLPVLALNILRDNDDEEVLKEY